MSNTQIEVVNISKEFDGGAIRALQDVSLSIGVGEFVAITGPSGCGKSTLLHLLAALDRPTSGSVSMNGVELSSKNLNHYRRREIGLVFQLHNLLPHLNARQNIEVAMFSNGETYSQQRRRARALLRDVDLGDRENARPPQLSGGERQRLAIARSLANQPSILLADEPTGSLDSASVEAVLALLRRTREERQLTIVLVTHDAHVAAAADRTVRMLDGTVVSTGMVGAAVE